MKTTGYSIKDLEVLSGIKAHTIRIWEKRYDLLSPQRTDTNIRHYGDHDLRKMLNVSLLVRNGFKISKVAQWDDDKVKKIIFEVTETKTSHEDYIDRLILNMVNFDIERFSKLTNEIISEIGFEEAITNVYFNLFIRIGTYWQVGAIFPAQEHLITGILRQKLISETDKLESDKSKGLTMLIFLPENELHELSLLFYSYLANKAGYNVIYLGQSVPFEDLVKISSQLNIDYVFSAFINSIEKESLENYLVQLKGLFQRQKIFVTGWQIQIHTPELPRNVKTVKDYREFKKYLN